MHLVKVYISMGFVLLGNDFFSVDSIHDDLCLVKAGILTPKISKYEEKS